MPVSYPLPRPGAARRAGARIFFAQVLTAEELRDLAHPSLNGIACVALAGTRGLLFATEASMAGKARKRPEALMDNIRVVLETCRLNDHEAGRALGVAHPTAGRWRRKITLPVDLEAFCAWCGIPEEHLRTRPVEEIRIRT